MSEYDKAEITGLILNKAKELGADIAGVAPLSKVIASPSVQLASIIGPHDIGKGDGDYKATDAAWLYQSYKSIVVVGLAHPPEKPELDWWHGNKQPPGNRFLWKVVDKLSYWVKDLLKGVAVLNVPYHVENGGVFLKDAAVYAGLGVIGRNNLFINPVCGPRVRLRTLLVGEELFYSEPLSYDPCNSCGGLCIKTCPQNAFDNIVYKAENSDTPANLPSRNGAYSRYKCNLQMRKDVKLSGDVIKYCRNCEINCPAGEC